MKKRRNDWKENGEVLDTDDEGGWSDEQEEKIEEDGDLDATGDLAESLPAMNSIATNEPVERERTAHSRQAVNDEIQSSARQPNGEAEVEEAGDTKIEAEALLPNRLNSPDRETEPAASNHASKEQPSQESLELPSLSRLTPKRPFDNDREDGEAPVDEISRTYVRIEVPRASSPLSSLPPSPVADLEEPIVDDGSQDIRGETAGEAQPNITSSQAEIMQQAAELVDDSEYLANGRRYLRKRTTIQLHPYLIESERHKNQFKAAHMAPLNIVDTQERATARRTPRDEDSQDTDLETEGKSQESQVLDEIWGSDVLEELLDSPPRPQRPFWKHSSRLIPRPTSRGTSVQTPIPRREPIGSDDDDDLPDISDIINRPLSTQRRRELGQRPFSTIHAAALRAGLIQDHGATGNVFNIPKSLPPTSSPTDSAVLQATPAHPRRLHHRPMSRSGTAATTIPTPAASSERRVKPVPIAVPFDDESDDGPPSSVEQTPGSSPSREPVRIKKRLRGVLPASYLRVGTQIDRPRPILQLPVMRESRSLSPAGVRELNRKGVALPRTGSGMITVASTPRGTPGLGTNSLDFLGSQEESDDNGHRHDDISAMPGIVQEGDGEYSSVRSQSDFGWAMDDNGDEIDPMLPTQERKRRLGPDGRPVKRQKKSTSNPFHRLNEGHGQRRQPRITDVFEDAPIARPRQYYAHHVYENGTPMPMNALRMPIQRTIQEVMPAFDKAIEELPTFMRVAVRSAGSRYAMGRQGPAAKVVRLSEREATAEARSVIRQWRGTSPLQRRQHQQRKPSRAPLGNLSANVRSVPTARPAAKAPTQHGSLQASLQNFSRPAARQIKLPFQAPISADAEIIKIEGGRAKVEANVEGTERLRKQAQRARARARARIPIQVRPGQLEISQFEYQSRDSRAAFGTTKRTFDKRFRRYHGGAEPAGHTLARFLEEADGDSLESGHQDVREATSEASFAPVFRRKRKRTPMRIDAETARYRQPENIVASIEVPIPAPTLTAADLFPEKHLHGLHYPSYRYTIDFDVRQLTADVYFHESTFIGKQKLEKALKTDLVNCLDNRHPTAVTYQLGDRHFKWNIWEDEVEAEVKFCFQWIVGCLEDRTNEGMKVDPEVVDCMEFVVEYFQTALAFYGAEDAPDCIASMTTFLQLFTECLEALTPALQQGDNINNRRIMALSVLQAVLVFQVLRMATTNPEVTSQDPSVPELQELLKKATATSVKLLFVVGLSPLDELYEDLRAEAFRLAGIKEHHGPAEAWVILMHIMRAANVRRFSLWDAVNTHLFEKVDEEVDAAAMERSWRTMFLLLPLMEFDSFGILKSRSRYRTTVENWALPQKLIRRVVDLYTSDPEVLPKYTNYCNTLFNRCHHLIQAWGWRHYSAILGTLFDFFATHHFHHIGVLPNITIKSPEFLRDLDGALSSFVVSDDHCFHVFLKILHSAVMHLKQGKKEKDVGNLVTRLLPNHNYEDGQMVLGKQALANHKDLLAVLVWAAQGELKGRVEVMLDAVERRSRQKGLLQRVGSRRL